MSVALVARSVVVLGYLVALAVNGRLSTVTAMVAVAIVAVWAAALLRDGLHPAVRPARRPSSRYAAED